ncbi:tetratricopeptide repeat protein [Sulfuritortus calidifontis]|uniref:Tetratricopeptide repeat protein n=1 Tax=Sulfuritortus calidifontis TaxID=1914471 RepID=A0A4R3JYG6_9PROT|nr:response regulator [Sulfuritortus calidifontis]TCS72420.1 tetratricopeptide repeat protein [Sulfuritortus calidifontis]
MADSPFSLKPSAAETSCPFDRLRYMVIEDSNTMRLWLRNALAEMGGKRIDTATSYGDAINRIKNRGEIYDVVLCDYILSDARDGQQLLEEIRRTKALPSSAIWLMITGENTYEQVFSAAELAPDDYLLKPVSPKILLDRLEKAWLRKQALKPAMDLFDDGKFAECIAVCRAGIQAESPYKLDLLRQIGEAMLAQGHFQEAHRHFESIVAEYPRLPWARLGAARAYFMLERHDEAQELLEQLAIENPDFLHAQDWLAKVHEKKGDLEATKQILNELIEKNPKALHRHREIVRAAVATGDEQTARKAYELMHTHGKGSSFVQPADFCAYATLLVKQGGNEAGEKLASLNKQMMDFHHGKPEFNFANSMLKFSRASVLKDDSAMKQAYKSMQVALGDMLETDNEQRMAMLQAAVAVGDEVKAADLVRGLYADFHGNDQMLNRVDALLEGTAGAQFKALKAAALKEVEDLNRRAINIAKGGQLREAVNEFIRLAENHPILAITLNASVAIVKWMEENGPEPYLTNKLEQYIQFMKKRDPANPKLAMIIEAQSLLERNLDKGKAAAAKS